MYRFADLDNVNKYQISTACTDETKENHLLTILNTNYIYLPSITIRATSIKPTQCNSYPNTLCSE